MTYHHTGKDLYYRAVCTLAFDFHADHAECGSRVHSVYSSRPRLAILRQLLLQIIILRFLKLHAGDLRFFVHRMHPGIADAWSDLLCIYHMQNLIRRHTVKMTRIFKRKHT